MFQAYQNRRWITREEIAEIHEAVAHMDLFDEKADTHMQAADTIRATELLSNPIGARTA